MTTTYSQIGVLLELQEALGLCSFIPAQSGEAGELIASLQKRLSIEVRVGDSQWCQAGVFPFGPAILLMLEEAGMDTRYPITKREDHYNRETIFTGRRLVRELVAQERKPS